MGFQGSSYMISKAVASGARADAQQALQIGVIGAGIMGSNHARVLAGLPDTTLVGIVDPLPEHRARATDLVGCRAFASLDELIAEGVDAVTVAAPTHLHHEIALACIARNIHILVEKPIASSVEEGSEIVAAAHRAGVTLMVGHVERFNPAVAAIKQAISGEDILSIAITRVGPFPLDMHGDEKRLLQDGGHRRIEPLDMPHHQGDTGAMRGRHDLAPSSTEDAIGFSTRMWILRAMQAMGWAPRPSSTPSAINSSRLAKARQPTMVARARCSGDGQAWCQADPPARGP